MWYPCGKLGGQHLIVPYMPAADLLSTRARAIADMRADRPAVPIRTVLAAARGSEAATVPMTSAAAATTTSTPVATVRRGKARSEPRSEGAAVDAAVGAAVGAADDAEVLLYFRGTLDFGSARAKLGDALGNLIGWQSQVVFDTKTMSNSGAEWVQHSNRGYADQMLRSTFCLIVSGHTCQTRRFYDAVAAGCIPLLVDCPTNV